MCEMTNLSLEEQVEKLEHILNLYRTVSESDNKETMLSCLKQLSLDNLGILGDTTIRDWIIDFNKGERDDFKITQNISSLICIKFSFVIFNRANITVSSNE